MKITETASLQCGAAHTPGLGSVGHAGPDRAVQRVVMGGGWLTATAVASHVRRKTAGVRPKSAPVK
jgi:hypothetical protein